MKETRTVTQVKIWKLIMNPVWDRMESRRMVAWSDDKEKLVNYYNQSKVDSYTEDSTNGDGRKWHLNFSPTSLMHHFNPLSTLDLEPNDWGHGIFWEWVDSEIIDGLDQKPRIL
jgi:hypothetical protein